MHDAIALGAPATVVAVASRNAARAREYARSWNVPWHGTWRELLTTEIDAVYVNVPNALHTAFAREALLQGKHVLCEKPLTASRAEAVELTELARNSGLTLMEGMHYRELPGVRRCVELLLAGRIGPIEAVDVFYGWPLGPAANIRHDPKLHGGALMDVGSYGLDLAAWLLGDRPEVVRAAGDPFPSGVDARSMILLRAPCSNENKRARVRADLTYPYFACWAVVRGRHGRFVAKRPFLPVIPQTGGGRTSYYWQLDRFCTRVRKGTAARPDRRETEHRIVVNRAGVLEAAFTELNRALLAASAPGPA